MTNPAPPFRFLDLPREIRDLIYDYALCSFSHYKYTVEQHSRVHVQAPLRRRRFLGTINLLLANRQIHYEAYSYMLKTNLFVRVESRGVNIKYFLHGHAPPIHVLEFYERPDEARLERVNKFPWYAMRVWIRGHYLVSEQRFGKQGYWDIVLLREDLGEFCKRLEIERVPETQSGVRILVEIGPCGEEKTGIKGVLNEGIQKQLLMPVQEGLRGFQDITIKGCTDETLTQKTIQAVEALVYPEPNATMDKLKSQEDASTEAWLQGDHVRGVTLCAAGISTIARLCVLRTALVRFQETVPNFGDSLVRHYFKFHLCMARCLHTSLSAPPPQQIHAKDNIFNICTSIVRILDYLFTIPSKFPIMVSSRAHTHPDQEVASAHYLMAYALRLCDDRYAAVVAGNKALYNIKMAVELYPGNKDYEEEKRVVEDWLDSPSRP
ncbi:uncharacterized protein K460DRAFT_412405 [Cucurbitaria berberidis CBS 394.84]|uniref:Uncharacterized protein n=1 Tax=Cucurbitaria berberidis CBS 394.84 TaxID=1168544 RepID=A0A9P4GQH4_9PLEO|nr:uncharacterized protein K460DRAFT_412405 [Cucurbitaria berberidis CBS 394.84]KAF1850753.1 hypothetical protein K460DRAFT_412405 [Cucurbitaria berberidis CBS 394.84]